MEKIKGDSFFWCWSIIGLLGTIIIWNLPWRFQVNDDEIMMWLVSGAYTGTPESYAVFIHPLLSWGLASLYSFSPLIPWYPITWFVIVYLSFLAGILSISKHSMNTSYRILLAIILLSISIHFLYFLQFTQVAGFASFGGLLLVLNSKKSRLQWAIGGVLFFAGALVRIESAVLILIGFVVWILFNFERGRLLMNLKKTAPILLTCLVLVIGKSVWENHSEYSEFLKFNKARSSVIDHPVFFKKVTNEEIKEDSPWFFFSRWFFEEGEIEVDHLRAMKSQLDSELFTWGQVQSSLSRMVTVQGAEAFKSFLWILVVGLFLMTQAPKNKKFMLCWLVGMMILNHFFVFYGRVSILFLLVLFFPVFSSPLVYKNKKVFVLISSVLILGISYHTFNFLQEGEGRETMKKEMLQLTGANPSQEPIFLEGYQEHMFGLDYNALNPVPFINQGWVSRSPFQKQAFRRFHVEYLHELPSYSLLAIRMDEPVVFPDYMKSLNPSYYQIDYQVSLNFQLVRYRIN